MCRTWRQLMPENKTLDPFKPAQPRIPGVSDHSDQEEARLQTAETPEELHAAEIGRRAMFQQRYRPKI